MTLSAEPVGKIHWGRHLRLVLSTALEHVGTDPVVFGLQVSRRLPSSLSYRLARPLAAAHPWAPGMGGLGLHIRGRDDELEELFDRAVREPAVLRRDHQRRRRLAEVAQAVDAVDHAFRLTAELPGGLRRSAGTLARRDWYLGDMGSAVENLQRGWLSGRATRAEKRQLLRLVDERAQFHGTAPDLRSFLGSDENQLAGTYQPQPQTVLHVLTNSVPHTSSGYALRSHALLSAQARAGWDVHAMTRPGYPVQVGRIQARDQDVIDGVTYHRINPGRLPETATGRLDLFARELMVRCLLTRPAVLHTTTHFVNAMVVGEVARVLGIPWVYEVRGQLADTWASRRPAAAEASERYLSFTGREAQVLRQADDVAALGGAMAERIEEITHGAVRVGDVRLAPNAVGPEYEAEPEPVADVRRRLSTDRWSVPDAGFLVGTVTSVVDYEGLDDLIRATARWPEGITTVIVGEGTARPGLQELARQLGVADRVVFTGRVTKAEAKDWQRALDVFVVPRRDRAVTRAVTPLKIVEAGASAIPVVASRLPAIQETVRHGVTGLLVPPENPAELADAVLQLWADRGLAHRLGRAGRDAVLRDRTWSAVAAGTIGRYDQLTSAASRERGGHREHPTG
ncbi:glycosyltransferase [Kocuria sp. JC486]|uniref:Glycosyltransferase WbuB n=1 Tax=Kocuria soli TaxID=2485125 RepID=A0A3N3ZU47_9MICC|nr:MULTISPECIES: glycosyltransferase family 4 protein [Kocuria]NHU84254.1 glycosyltransferase [Kocuria sp. JC486]ROZ63768.1 glycosyltransferase WbuB [Kocuria soli]